MITDQKQTDFKTALLKKLDLYMTRAEHIVDGGHPIYFSIPESTSMEDAARFFFSMLNKYVQMQFQENARVLYDDFSIGIGYDKVYQCLVMGIMIYE